jgi:excisionase family DNA binding protein
MGRLRAKQAPPSSGGWQDWLQGPFADLQTRFVSGLVGVLHPGPKRGPSRPLWPAKHTLDSSLGRLALLPGSAHDNIEPRTDSHGRRFSVERLLSIREAASLLGVRPQTLYLWVSKKRIAHRKIGRLVRFTEADLAEFVERQRQPAVDSDNERL